MKVVEKIIRKFAQASVTQAPRTVPERAPDKAPEQLPFETPAITPEPPNEEPESQLQHWDGKVRWPAPKKDRPEVVYDLDGDFHSMYDQALSAVDMKERFMRRQRHYLIAKLLPQVAKIPGDMAEVGCFRGLSAHLTSSIATKIGLDRTFHIFDSFEGLSESSTEDGSLYNLPTEGAFACSEEQVRENLKEFSFIEFYKGWVPERFNEVADKTFCYVHVDVDLFEPTKACLEFFWPRLAPGGVMILDDHGTVFWPGARQAAENFFSERSDVVVVETPSGNAAAIKLK